MTDDKGTRRTVKSAETSFAIIETIGGREKLTLTEVAEELDLAKSTVHRYLQTLLELQYLIEEDGGYRLSLRFLEHGSQSKNRVPGYNLVRQKVDQLAAETDERVQFIVEEYNQGVYVYREVGAHAVLTDPGIGRRIDLHATAAGKAILTEWSDQRIRELVEDRGLQPLTSQTITEEEKLFEDVETSRERGYTINNEESLDGLSAVGVPITGPGDVVIGSLSISGPVHRMKGEWFDQELPDKLMGYAKEIELNLRYG